MIIITIWLKKEYHFNWRTVKEKKPPAQPTRWSKYHGQPQQEMGIQVSMFWRWKSKEVINPTSVLILFSLLSPTDSNCVVSSHFDWNWILTNSIHNFTFCLLHITISLESIILYEELTQSLAAVTFRFSVEVYPKG